ncbi:MAG: hypothetical protein U1F98_10715 [Verrucomicrobiota bacterium]
MKSTSSDSTSSSRAAWSAAFVALLVSLAAEPFTASPAARTVAVSGAAATVLALGFELPLQNVLLAAAIAAAGGAALLAPGAGAWTPLFWIIGLLNARGVVQLLLGNSAFSGRRGFPVAAATLPLFLGFLAVLQSVFSPDSGWNPARAVLTVFAAAACLALATPALLDKRGLPRRDHPAPALVWILVLVWPGIACLRRREWGAAAAAGVLLGAGVAGIGLAAWRRIRSRATAGPPARGA